MSEKILTLFKELAVKNESKIILVVLDGIGDLPNDKLGGQTPLEAAKTPNLDELAKRSNLGLLEPIYTGITPGSGPGHFGVFGYDPLSIEVGRGVLSALGVGIEITKDDVAARGNFCTVDASGVVTDRRAGRIPTSECERLCKKISEKVTNIGGVDIIVSPEEEHRFVLILKGHGLGGAVSDTDPQKTGLKPLAPSAHDAASEKTAQVISRFVQLVADVLKDESRANMVLLRGFDKLPHIPSLSEIYKLTPCAIASYPMYKGIAKLVGMDVLPLEGHGELMDEKIALLETAVQKYDYIFLHMKKTDSYGEDGNAEAKVKQIEAFDALLPRILALNPTVLAITGDHSTPCPLKQHSWHPVPLLFSAPYLRKDSCKRFTEAECARGILGIMPSMRLLGLMMAHAGKLKKFGA